MHSTTNRAKHHFRRILVTGAAGFMGSHLVDYLLRKDCPLLIKDSPFVIYGVDDLSGGFMRNINPGSRFTKLDLRDTKAVAKYIDATKPDLIYHLAADAAEGRSQFVPIDCTRRNYIALLNLLVPAVKNGLKKIVVTSSMSVYGRQPVPFTEAMRPQPDDIYGLAKYAVEEGTRILAEVFHFDYCLIRPHNVYGPRQNLADPYRNVIAIFINRLLAGKHFFIYGSGRQKRAFTYIDDFTPYMALAGLTGRTNGETINLGPRQEHTIDEVAQMVLNVFFDGKSYPKKYTPQHLDWRPKEVVEAYCTMDKAQKLLGYKPQTSLEEGITKMIAWARTVGWQKPAYVEKLEIVNDQTPATWLQKLI